ncbi:mitochondrial-processing peptidase subunit alpha-like [Curcuma longa]|uniref:mitochondrial-processing peptidase subunit alpha-like n=1 Tax=Curcuma longa TaxID=136217 RepID=UPI003D9E0F5E
MWISGITIAISECFDFQNGPSRERCGPIPTARFRSDGGAVFACGSGFGWDFTRDPPLEPWRLKDNVGAAVSPPPVSCSTGTSRSHGGKGPSWNPFGSELERDGSGGAGLIRSGPEFISKAVDLAARELLAVATPGQVDQVQLNRAKESTKSAVLMNLESRMVASEDIGRQILTYGERKPVEHFLKAVDELTLEDISSLAEKIISSPLTMASWGDVNHVPGYKFVRAKFHAN